MKGEKVARRQATPALCSPPLVLWVGGHAAMISLGPPERRPRS